MPSRHRLPPPKTRVERAGVRSADGKARRGDEDVALRLGIGRDGIGIELARPVVWGCIRVTELATTMPALRFPVDVSGGVSKFRHRRGALAHVEIEVGARVLERWAAPRLRGIVGAGAPELWIAADASRATASVASVIEPEAADAQSPVLAFEVHGLAEGEDLVLVVTNARGLDLPAPPTALAIACMAEVLGRSAERRGAAFVSKRVATAVVRALLPAAGARIPATDASPWCVIAAQGDTWILRAMRAGVVAAPTAEAVLAREVAALVADGDEALIRGDLDAAREEYFHALEHAPRQKEIVRRIADVDARVPGRAEAALATLADARANAGFTAGVLLLQVGDLDAGMASLELAAQTEPAPALAARAYELAARSARDTEAAARWLDEALARAPRAMTARWARVQARLALGRLEDAFADVQHLEALASGGSAKHAVWMRAGVAWRAAGYKGYAGAVYERALRFAPDSPSALAGLGTSMAEGSDAARGAAILERALGLATERSDACAGIALALARVLAERLGDLPTAIAHVSAIRKDDPEAPLARGLEGRWRVRLGDLIGAGLAFARLRELSAAFAAPPPDDGTTAAVVDFLVEAADMELTKRRDALAAQRYLAAALRLRPRHTEALAAYRRVGADLSRDDEADHSSPTFDSTEPASATHMAGAMGVPRLDLGLAPDTQAPTAEENGEREARVEELTRRLQANPNDEVVADELAGLLELLDRGHELVALLNARLEDASPDRLAELVPRALSAYERLAVQADANGRSGEAAIYREAAQALRARHRGV